MMTLVSEKDEFYHDIDQLDDYSNEKNWTTFITKDDVKHLLTGKIINDYSDGEYFHPLGLTKEAIEFIKGIEEEQTWLSIYTTVKKE